MNEPVAGQDERLGLVAPGQSFDVEAPEVPIGGRDVRGIGIQMLDCERGDFSWAGILSAQIPLRYEWLNSVHRLFEFVFALLPELLEVLTK